MSDHPPIDNNESDGSPRETGSQPVPLGNVHPVQLKIHLPERKNIVSYSILGITILVFVLQMASQYLMGFDLPSAYLIKSNQLIDKGQFWRLITPLLLHGSILHIAFNMYALYVLGPGLERFYGHLRFLLLYLVGGFVGNVFSYILSPANSLGASTAIFGLVIAQAVFIYRNRFLFGKQARYTLINIGGIVVVNLILGLSPGIDNWGHVGGLVGGLAFAWFAGPLFKLHGTPPDVTLNDTQSGSRMWTTALLLVAAFGVVVVTNLML